MLKGWIDRVWVQRRRLRPAAGVEPRARPPAQRAPDRRHHDARLVQVRQRAGGRGRQAHGHAHAARRVPPAGAHDVDRHVRHRHGDRRRAPRPSSTASNGSSDDSIWARSSGARRGSPAPAGARSSAEAGARRSTSTDPSGATHRAHRARLRPAPARPRAARAERRGDHRADARPSSTWEIGTQLAVTRRPVEAMPLTGARLFADGLSSWLIRRADRRRRVGRVRPPGRLRARPRRARRVDGRDARAAPPERSVRVVGELRRAALGRADVAPRAADRDRGSTP